MEKISLPIDAELSRIIKAFNEFPNLILTASPGSGKTTRVPPALLQLSELKNKKIIVLVPKRIAALSAASRVADETETTIGEAVGYQVRFDNRSQAQTRLIYMTEGVFIKKINDSSFWQSIGVIVFDEFHERSSNMDLALGISLEKQILGEDLKLIVMSATLNAEKLLNFLPDSKWIDVENKPFPLTIVNSKKSQRLACDQAFADNLIETLQTALTKTERDILIFLPGLSEMRFIERQLLPKFSKFEINILHGSTKLEEQRRILTPQSHRRIILATNIAESSVTLPSVDLVIDSGLEKKSVTENKIGFKRLELGRISMFSAQQRAGRAARVKEGYCFRLWHSMDELSMPAQIEPEILTSDLFNETLTLLSSGITDPKNFSWLDRPSKSFEDVLAQLNKWQLIDDQRHITAYGRSVQNCPLDLERSVLFVALAQAGFQKEAARLLSFIETAAFDKLTEAVDLRLLPLNEMARKIEQQLLQIRIATVKESSTLNFKTQIIKTFFEKFPNKIAKKKEKNLAVSSLGRGLELAPYLVNNTDQYYLLIDGREISSALTRAEFAIGFTQAEFEQLSAEHIQVVTETHLDIEKRKIFKIEKKCAGLFVISESSKSYLDEKTYPEIFQHFLKTQFKELVEEHRDYKNYVTKINFLKKKSGELNLNGELFSFLERLLPELQSSLGDTVTSLEEFFDLNLLYFLKQISPPEIQNLLAQLPNEYKLANGKHFAIDYSSEQAPKISARIQEFYNQKTNPALLDGKLRITLELLAPNYRPTQVTSQLENFWKSGYFEIKKELKARYPKHAWPDDPANFIMPERPPRK